MTKKILATIALGITVFILLSIKVNDAYADAIFTDMTWSQFANQCPYDTI